MRQRSYQGERITITFEYTIEILKDEEYVEHTLEVEASYYPGKPDYYCTHFGNYYPGDDVEIDIFSVFFDGEEVGLESILLIANDPSLKDRLEQRVIDESFNVCEDAS